MPERKEVAPDTSENTATPAAARAPTTGTLLVTSDVPDAQVFLDRVYAGVAPVTIRDVSPGSHRLNVSAEGFEGVAEDVEVEPGARELAIRLREVRLKASIDVVHKHRTGSCTGTLTATPQGIRYETANADDAFSGTLNDLEGFDVDYLAKNLRVKARGKVYNFTDPEGNADRLFVFHRDVEKARARLAKGDAPGGD